MTMGLMYILPFDYIESGIAVISGLIGLQIYTIVFYFKFKDKEQLEPIGNYFYPQIEDLKSYIKDYSLSILFPKSNLRRNCQEKVQCMPSDHTGGIAVSPKSYSAGAAEVNKKQ